MKSFIFNSNKLLVIFLVLFFLDVSACRNNIGKKLIGKWNLIPNPNTTGGTLSDNEITAEEIEFLDGNNFTWTSHFKEGPSLTYDGKFKVQNDSLFCFHNIEKTDMIVYFSKGKLKFLSEVKILFETNSGEHFYEASK